MDWNRVEGNWKQFKGQIKEKWGNLTDDDLDRVAGQRDQLEGVIQERYGRTKSERTLTPGSIHNGCKVAHLRMTRRVSLGPDPTARRFVAPDVPSACASARRVKQFFSGNCARYRVAACYRRYIRILTNNRCYN